MTQHLTEFRDRMNNLHAQITQTYLMALNDPLTAGAWFANQLVQIRGLEQEHNAWASAYFAEVRAAFGMNSEAERQAAQMSSGVSRWIAQDAIYVLLGNSMAGLAGGRLQDAHQAADEALRRCDALAQQGMDVELANQRMMAWGQMTLVAYKTAADNPGDRMALGNARAWAERCFQEAAQAGQWLLAAEARAILASCAWMQDDRMTFSSTMNEAIQIATNSGAMIRNLAAGGQYVPLASYLQSWMWEMQAGADRTGDTTPHPPVQRFDARQPGESGAPAPLTLRHTHFTDACTARLLTAGVVHGLTAPGADRPRRRSARCARRWRERPSRSASTSATSRLP